MEKKGVVLGLNEFTWLLIAVAVLILVLIIIGIATGKIGSGFDYIKNIFRFGPR
jgi:hypothetical protein